MLSRSTENLIDKITSDEEFLQEYRKLCLKFNRQIQSPHGEERIAKLENIDIHNRNKEKCGREYLHSNIIVFIDGTLLYYSPYNKCVIDITDEK